MIVVRVNKPVLNWVILFDSQKSQPMGGNAQHQMQDHRLGSSIFPELLKFLSELIPAVVLQD